MRGKLRSFFSSCVAWLTPSPRAWHGAAWALLSVTAVLWLITGYYLFTSGEVHLGTWLVYLAVTVAARLAGLLIQLAINLLKARDRFFSWTSAACLVVLILIFGNGGGPGPTIGAALAVALAASLIGAA